MQQSPQILACRAIVSIAYMHACVQYSGQWTVSVGHYLQLLLLLILEITSAVPRCSTASQYSFYRTSSSVPSSFFPPSFCPDVIVTTLSICFLSWITMINVWLLWDVSSLQVFQGSVVAAQFIIVIIAVFLWRANKDFCRIQTKAESPHCC